MNKKISDILLEDLLLLFLIGLPVYYIHTNSNINLGDIVFIYIIPFLIYKRFKDKQRNKND